MGKNTKLLNFGRILFLILISLNLLLTKDLSVRHSFLYLNFSNVSRLFGSQLLSVKIYPSGKQTIIGPNKIIIVLSHAIRIISTGSLR